mgnify:CR=1 FL=1
MPRHRLSGLFLGCSLLFSHSLSAEVTHINNQELEQMLKDGVPVIDIRRAEEWQQTGVVEGSHLLTFFDKQGKYNFPKWHAGLDKIAQADEPFILICRTGNRTNLLSQALDKQLGYSKVYNVKKGITHWKTENFPVVAPEQPVSEEK